jgi:hypothetical protein
MKIYSMPVIRTKKAHLPQGTKKVITRSSKLD